MVQMQVLGSLLGLLGSMEGLGVLLVLELRSLGWLGEQYLEIFKPRLNYSRSVQQDNTTSLFILKYLFVLFLYRGLK
jgi:hypothetical protein